MISPLISHCEGVYEGGFKKGSATAPAAFPVDVSRMSQRRKPFFIYIMMH